jgi:hypothetical protein
MRWQVTQPGSPRTPTINAWRADKIAPDSGGDTHHSIVIRTGEANDRLSPANSDRSRWDLVPDVGTGRALGASERCKQVND